MKPLVEDKELKRLREMALGARAYRRLTKWEELAALPLKEIMCLPARERLGVGYYTCARQRATQDSFT